MPPTDSTNNTLAVVGSGVIACSLAATAVSHRQPVLLYARSDASAARARATVDETLRRLGSKVDPKNVGITTDMAALKGADFVVEAIVEDLGAKATLHRKLNGILEEKAILASTTSSLSVESLAKASGRRSHFVGLHVFNPVTKMQLVELIFPTTASDHTRESALELCAHLEKVPIVVPDKPGFVVNRLLFPYLFAAVRLVEEGKIQAKSVDDCMRLGAGHPMGPLALLDLVGLDVAKAIGETIEVEVPAMVGTLIDEGKLGRKSKQGFHSY